MDSFGCATGVEEVRARVLSKTAELLGGDVDVATELLDGITFDDLEVRSRWWPAVPDGVSGLSGINQRLTDLMDQARHT